MTREEFGVGIAAFCAVTEKVYPRETLDVFFKLMKDLRGESFLKAIEVICQSQKEIYPNTNVVALIRDKAAELENPNPIPEEAWEIVLKSFDDARIVYPSAVQRTVEIMGGREELRWIFRDTDKPSIIRGQFIQYYAGISKSEHQARVSPAVAMKGSGAIEDKGQRPSGMETIGEIIPGVFKEKSAE